jgi:hypothetical protein
VSNTISAMESAIASWDAAQEKPERYADTIAAMKRLLPRLEEWERKSLKSMNADEGMKRKSLDELVRISDSSKGDF